MSNERIYFTRRRGVIAATAGAAIVVLATARPAQALFGVGDIVFDPANLAQHVLILEQHAQQLLQLKAQVEQMDRMLQDWDFSRLDETLAQMETIHGQLDTIGSSLGDLAGRFPDDWTGSDPHHADASINPQLKQWRSEQRQRAEQTVELHQAIADSIAGTRGRVADYVAKSNAAPGQLAAQQATNELLAVQVQQLQELQALEVAALRSEIERQAAAISYGEWEDAHLRDDHEVAAQVMNRLDASPGFSDGSPPPASPVTPGQHRAALTGN